MNNPITETAQWKTQYYVAFGADPSDKGTTTPSGADWYDAGDVAVSAIATNSTYEFSFWSATGSITLGDSGSASTTATISGPGTVTATFTPKEYALTVNIVGSGTVAKNPDQATYHYGDNVELTAYAATGWTFSGWSQDLTGTTNPSTVTIDETPEVTATFTQNDYVLLVTINPPAGGSVVRNPDQATYHYGDTVELTAYAATGWTFSGWSQDLTGTTNPSTVTIDETPQVTATFTQNDYVLVVTINPPAGGSVGRNPSQATYHYGDTVELTAYAATGWTFSGWSQDLTGTTNPSTVTIDETPQVTATFTRSQFTLTINVSPSGSGTVTKDPDLPMYGPGTVVQLMAIPSNGSRFVGWSGALTGSTNPTTITMDSDKTVTATFATGTATSMNVVDLAYSSYHWKPI